MGPEPVVVKPLDLTTRLGKVRNRIDLVGIELEGGWRVFPKGERWEEDMSAFRKPSLEDIKECDRLGVTHYGELPSKTMYPLQILPWLKRCYPIHVNDTCGMHIHMSFKSLKHYSRLMVEEYPATVKYYVGLWAKEIGLPPEHCLWERINGKNEYCHDAFWPDLQIAARKDHDRKRKGNRYTDINYSYTSHKTIECRLLPMMQDAETGYSGLKLVMDVTNACLSALADIEKMAKVYKLDLSVKENAVDFMERDIVEL